MVKIFWICFNGEMSRIDIGNADKFDPQRGVESSMQESPATTWIQRVISKTRTRAALPIVSDPQIRNRLVTLGFSTPDTELLLSLQQDPTNKELLNRYAFSGLRSKCFPDGILRPDLADIADQLPPPPDKATEISAPPDPGTQKIKPDPASVLASESVDTPASAKTTRRNFLVSGLVASGLAAIGLSNEKRREETGNIVRGALAMILDEKPNLSYATTVRELIASLKEFQGIDVSVDNIEHLSKFMVLVEVDDLPVPMQQDIPPIPEQTDIHRAIGKTVANHRIDDVLCSNGSTVLNLLAYRIVSGGDSINSSIYSTEYFIRVQKKRLQESLLLPKSEAMLLQIKELQQSIVESEKGLRNIEKEREEALIALGKILGTNDERIVEDFANRTANKSVKNLIPMDRLQDTPLSPPLSPDDIARGLREKIDREDSLDRSMVLCEKKYMKACEKELKKHREFGVVLIRAKESGLQKDATSVAQQNNQR